MKSTITIRPSRFIQNIIEKDLLYNQLTSHIIKDYSSNKCITNCHILYFNSNFYYNINLNDYNYTGKINCNEFNINFINTKY